MSIEEKVLLNLVFFDNRFRELELKQWWLAEEIGVDRKTIGRWLTGQTKKIRRDNLEKLSKILECIEEDLILKDESSQFTSAKEQKDAAKLIEQENLLEILTPTGKWPLLEGLIKASLEPNLPISLLGQLYNFLCIAAWRQSHLERAESYLKKALDIATTTGHKSVMSRAKLNEATLASFRGDIKKSIEGFQYCIKNEKYLDEPAVLASALSNIGCVYQEFGDLESSIKYQKKAIDAFEKLERPLNLSIAWIGLCDVYLEKNMLDEAWSACNKSLEKVKESHMQRGFGDCNIFFSLISSARGEFQEAYDFWIRGKDKFDELQVNEARTYRAGAIALAGLGRPAQAIELLNKALEVGKDFIFEMFQIHMILYTIDNEVTHREKAIAILKKMGADERLSKYKA